MDAPASDVRALAASGRLDEAEALLADHLSTQPRHGEARLGWAALAAEIGSLSLALDELRAATREAPDSVRAAAALADLAGELADLGVEHPSVMPPVDGPPAPPPTEPDVATLARYLHAFGGREGVHARQWVSPQADGTLRQGYAPQQIPLTPRLAAAHLAGDCSLGTYLIRLDDTVTFFVIDLDIRRKALAAAAQDHQENRRVRQVLAASTAAIEARLGAHGLACIVEDSGHKGRHFWCLLQAPMAADLVHRFGRALLAALSADLPPELSLEFFPKQGRVDADGLGNLIKLPLGVHPVSGRRSTFLDRAGRPVETPWATLGSTPRVAPAEVMAAFEALRADAAPRPPPSPAEAPTPQAEAALRKVIAGCPVVATILTRAAETRRIGHDERIVLLHSLGHLAAGLGPIEALFRACPEVPLRDVPAKVRRGHPISCARIRARVPHITATVACHCEFPCLGEYPSPLLHAAGGHMRALLTVQRAGATVGLAGESIEVRFGRDVLASKPLAEVAELHLYGTIELTAAARTRLLRAGVDTLFLSPAGRLQGALRTRVDRGGQRRLAQLHALADEARTLELARLFVEGKLANQRSLCLRMAREHRGPQAVAAAVALGRLQARAPTDLDTLRGVEGQGAAVYFRALGEAIRNPLFSFTKRTRRPPTDPVNACLSFGYTLVLARVEAALLRAGLEPCLGALHAADHGKPALALDVMEPLRPMVDRLVLRLINRRQLEPADFVHPDVDPSTLGAPPTGEVPAQPAVYLGERGRAIFLPALQALWRQPVQGRQGRSTLQAHLDAFAAALGRRFEGADGELDPPEDRLMYLLLCYDISGNARRQQLHTRLKAFLRPVQKSVFEGPLDDRRYRDLLRLVHRFVQHEVDSVRIYRLCGTCTHAMTLIGTAVPVPDGPEDVFV